MANTAIAINLNLLITISNNEINNIVSSKENSGTIGMNNDKIALIKNVSSHHSIVINIHLAIKVKKIYAEKTN